MDCVDNFAEVEGDESSFDKVEEKEQKTLEDVWFLNKQEKTLAEKIFDFIRYGEDKTFDDVEIKTKIKELLGLEVNVPDCRDGSTFVKWFETASTKTQKQLEQRFNEATNVQVLYWKRKRETDEQEVQNLHTQLMVSQKKRKLCNLNEEKKKKIFVPKMQRKEQKTSVITALFL